MVDGTPAEGWKVAARAIEGYLGAPRETPPDGPMWLARLAQTTRTGADGSYRLDGLRPGRYVIVVVGATGTAAGYLRYDKGGGSAIDIPDPPVRQMAGTVYLSLKRGAAGRSSGAAESPAALR
jgi:hypothetical protein